MSVLLGGRAAEQVVFGHLSTGAADDLVRTTDIARSMVTKYGMVPELGHVAYDRDRQGFLGGPARCPLSARTASRPHRQSTGPCARWWTRRSGRRSRSSRTARRALRGARGLLLEKETLDEAHS